jgi:hypothetical protein
MRLRVRISCGTYLLFKGLALQQHLPMAHLVRRAMHEHWQQALHETTIEQRSVPNRQVVVLRLRPSLAERVRLAVNRNRSAMVERCCLLYLDSYLVDSAPGKSHDGRQQQTDSNPDGLATSAES